VPVLVLAGGVLLVSATPVGVTWADTAVAHRILTKSTFTAGALVAVHVGAPARLGQSAGFDDEPAARRLC
jgi:hypothetical protein